MKHIIIGVPQDGEFATFTRELPESAFDDLRRVMDWKDENDHLYDFQLTKNQIQKIEGRLQELSATRLLN
ncbi:hypothetical protein [Stutzerimonas stutzeri]|uniref:hypothetical protein n=1 Tax=Stutzerimonas stutzeri TaxID=316 RepID=UPI00188C1FB4|nr:hypothetical protein [Stutzerimonas stutzeri]QOZ96542.1 hypothetical protein Pstu14405_14965 [Stutzerimonas stutzeri]